MNELDLLLDDPYQLSYALFGCKWKISPSEFRLYMTRPGTIQALQKWYIADSDRFAMGELAQRAGLTLIWGLSRTEGRLALKEVIDERT